MESCHLRLSSRDNPGISSLLQRQFWKKPCVLNLSILKFYGNSNKTISFGFIRKTLGSGSHTNLIAWKLFQKHQKFNKLQVNFSKLARLNKLYTKEAVFQSIPSSSKEVPKKSDFLSKATGHPLCSSIST